MGFYDGAQRPQPDKDPTKQIQWEIQHLAQKLGGDLMQALIEMIEGAIGAALEGLGGIFTGLFEALLSGNIVEGIETFLTNMPGVGFLVKAILGDGFEVGDLADWFTDMFGGITKTIIDLASNFLVPIGHLTNKPVNLLVAGDFKDIHSFAAGSGWVWDASKGRSSLGCAKAVANGQPRELMSIDIKVVEGQKISQEVWTQWAGASYTGTNHVQLGLRLYSGDDEASYTGTHVIQSLTLTGAAQATWQRLGGDYIVPAGVTRIRTTLKVNQNVSLGEFWFDDADAKKTGLIEIPWVRDLDRVFDGILDMLGLSFLDDLIAPNVEGIWSSIITTIMNPLGLIEDLLSRDLIGEMVDGFGNILEGIPFAGPFLASLWETLTEFFDDHLDTAATASDAKLGLTATREIAVSTITGNEVEAPVDTEVEEAFAGQTDVVGTLAYRLAVVEAQLADLTTPATIIVVSEQWEYSASTPDPLMWELYGYGPVSTGHVGVDGHDLRWYPSGGGQQGVRLKYIGPDAQSTHNLAPVYMTMGASSIPSNFHEPSYMYLITAANEDFDTFIQARFGRGDVRLSVFNAGNESVIGTQEIPSVPGVGAEFGLIPYNDGCEIKVNSSTYEFETLAHVPILGSANRFRGLGLHAGLTTAFGAFAQGNTGRVAYWSSRNAA